MSKSKKSKQEQSDPFPELLGEDVYYHLLADAKYDIDTRWVGNPLHEVDCQLGFLECGVANEHEVAEDIVYWVDNALECIEANGVNYRWNHFNDFDGKFTSRAHTPIGAILREMHAVHEFMAWKPYLERIRAIAAPMVKTDIAEREV